MPPDAAAEEESVLSPEPMGGGLLLKKPLSDSDFCTPDNSFHERRSSRKHMGEQLPKLPEFSMPDVGLEGKALSGHDSALEEKTDSVLQSVASALTRYGALLWPLPPLDISAHARPLACNRRQGTSALPCSPLAKSRAPFGPVVSFKYRLQPWVFLAFSVQVPVRRGCPPPSTFFALHSLTSCCLDLTSPGL